MHSFVVVEPPAVTNPFSTLEISPDTSITIEQVRRIPEFLSLKPSQGNISTVIIHEAHLLTLPAQQALLKTLEEPPSYALIYLVTPNPDQLLPTVLSRCQIIYSAASSATPDYSVAAKLFLQLLPAGVGERLQLIEAADFKRDSALVWLEHLEYFFASQLIAPVAQINIAALPDYYQLLHLARRHLKANVNVRLAVDNFVLSLH